MSIKQTKKRVQVCAQSSSESGEDPNEEDHADEGEGDQDEHQPQQPVDGLLGVLLQALRLRLQLLVVLVCLAHGLAQSLGGRGRRDKYSRFLHHWRLVGNLLLPSCGQITKDK